MSDIQTIDVSHIRFSSTAQPTEEDIELWNSLTPEEQHAVILRDLEEARQSGFAPRESKDEILARVRAEKTK